MGLRERGESPTMFNTARFPMFPLSAEREPGLTPSRVPHHIKQDEAAPEPVSSSPSHSHCDDFPLSFFGLYEP